MGQQQVDGVFAQVPRWRAIAARLAAGQTDNRLVGAHQISFFLFARLGCRRNMRPTVVSDLMPACDDRLAFVRPALDRKARNKPGCFDSARLQEIEDSLRSNRPE